LIITMAEASQKPPRKMAKTEAFEARF